MSVNNTTTAVSAAGPQQPEQQQQVNSPTKEMNVVLDRISQLETDYRQSVNQRSAKLQEQSDKYSEIQSAVEGQSKRHKQEVSRLKLALKKSEQKQALLAHRLASTLSYKNEDETSHLRQLVHMHDDQMQTMQGGMRELLHVLGVEESVIGNLDLLCGLDPNNSNSNNNLNAAADQVLYNVRRQNCELAIALRKAISLVREKLDVEEQARVDAQQRACDFLDAANVVNQALQKAAAILLKEEKQHGALLLLANASSSSTAGGGSPVEAKRKRLEAVSVPPDPRHPHHHHGHGQKTRSGSRPQEENGGFQQPVVAAVGGRGGGGGGVMQVYQGQGQNHRHPNRSHHHPTLPLVSPTPPDATLDPYLYHQQQQQQQQEYGSSTSRSPEHLNHSFQNSQPQRQANQNVTGSASFSILPANSSDNETPTFHNNSNNSQHHSQPISMTSASLPSSIAVLKDITFGSLDVVNDMQKIMTESKSDLRAAAAAAASSGGGGQQDVIDEHEGIVSSPRIDVQAAVDRARATERAIAGQALLELRREIESHAHTRNTLQKKVSFLSSQCDKLLQSVIVASSSSSSSSATPVGGGQGSVGGMSQPQASSPSPHNAFVSSLLAGDLLTGGGAGEFTGEDYTHDASTFDYQEEAGNPDNQVYQPQQQQPPPQQQYQQQQVQQQQVQRVQHHQQQQPQDQNNRRFAATGNSNPAPSVVPVESQPQQVQQQHQAQVSVTASAAAAAAAGGGGGGEGVRTKSPEPTSPTPTN